MGFDALASDLGRAAFQAGVGQQFGDHFLQLAQVGVHIGDQFAALTRVGLLLELVEFKRQSCNWRTQLMGHRIGEFALVGDQALDTLGHLIEVPGQFAHGGAARQQDARAEVVVTKTLCGQTDVLQVTPMRTHPEIQHYRQAQTQQAVGPQV